MEPINEGVEMLADPDVLGDHGFGWVALHPFVDERTHRVKYRIGKVYGGERFIYRGDPGKPPKWAKAVTAEGAAILNAAIAKRAEDEARKLEEKRRKAAERAAAGIKGVASDVPLRVVEVAEARDLAPPAAPTGSNLTSAARKAAGQAAAGRKAVSPSP